MVRILRSLPPYVGIGHTRTQQNFFICQSGLLEHTTSLDFSKTTPMAEVQKAVLQELEYSWIKNVHMLEAQRRSYVLLRWISCKTPVPQKGEIEDKEPDNTSRAEYASPYVTMSIIPSVTNCLQLPIHWIGGRWTIFSWRIHEMSLLSRMYGHLNVINEKMLQLPRSDVQVLKASTWDLNMSCSRDFVA